MNDLIEINDTNYNIQFDNNKNNFIIINFFANWCSPCKKMINIFKDISIDKDFKDFIFYLANIEKNDILVTKFNIKSIPTFVIVHNSKIINRNSGIISFLNFKIFINNSIN